MTERSASSIPGCRQAVLVDFTESERRNDNMGGKAAMDVIAGHLLVRADGRLAAPACVAMTARDHRRHDDRPVDPPHSVRPGIDDMAADLMPERQRQLMLGAHAIVVVAKIGVADAAACDFDEDFVRPGSRRLEFHRRSAARLCPSSSSELLLRSLPASLIGNLQPHQRATLFIIGIFRPPPAAPP